MAALTVTTMAIAGIELEVAQAGGGRPLLFLHAGEGLGAERPWASLLAKRHHVIAPVHPGFGLTPAPDWIGSVEDLAYLYLDLADKLDLKDAVLVGASFGGWIAAEMLVRQTARFSKVVLAAPLGIKVSGRDERDIADFHAMTHADYLARAWADPKKGEVDATRLSDAALRSLVQGRETLCLYGWKPYMHNPRLRSWLHRIDKPVHLVWGEADRILAPAYREGWSKALPKSHATTIAQAGHFPHWEQPERFADIVEAHARA